MKLYQVAIICTILALLGIAVLLSTNCGDVPVFTADIEGAYYFSSLNFTFKIDNNVFLYGLYHQAWNYPLINRDSILYEALTQGEKQLLDCINQNLENKPDAFEIAQNIFYELFDDYCFQCSLSPTGLCAGWTDGYANVKGCIYSRWKGNSYPTHLFAPHLLRTREDIYELTGINGWITEGSNYYATWEYDEPVLCHELEHILYDDKYNHAPQEKTCSDNSHITVFEF